MLFGNVTCNKSNESNSNSNSESAFIVLGPESVLGLNNKGPGLAVGGKCTVAWCSTAAGSWSPFITPHFDRHATFVYERRMTSTSSATAPDTAAKEEIHYELVRYTEKGSNYRDRFLQDAITKVPWTIWPTNSPGYRLLLRNFLSRKSDCSSWR